MPLFTLLQITLPHAKATTTGPTLTNFKSKSISLNHIKIIILHAMRMSFSLKLQRNLNPIDLLKAFHYMFFKVVSTVRLQWMIFGMDLGSLNF